MNLETFSTYKNSYLAVIRRVLRESEPGRLDESAFPAYSHNNFLINWLFWERLRVVMKHLEKSAPFERVLDFGCGSGVMLPFLAQHSQAVTAMDIDLLPLQRVQAYLQLPDNVSILDGSTQPLAALPACSFDAILALDVLEHIPDLPGALSALLALLKPGGELIVSGPTENLLYQIGRRIAGRQFSGAYHERGIAEIRTLLSQHASVQPLRTLYWPFPLFEVFAAHTG